MASDKDTKPSWYQTDVKSINPGAQQLLENYSGIPAEDVVSHVLKLRDEAFQICPYPCIGQMRFLSFHLSRHPLYGRVMEYLRNNPKAGFLDAGCCVGQEIRFLAHQGIPSHQLFALDLEQAFIDLGYQLFRDKDSLQATFTCGNLLEDNDSQALTQTLGGKIDIVFAGSLLHLWNYETQLKATTRLVRLLRDQVGVMVIGRQVGSLFAGDYPLTGFNDGTQYRHNLESLKGLWHDIGQATHTQWKVDASLEIDDVVRQNTDASWGDSNMRVIWWSATRIE
ncbi:class I SAM-dependent methyltransferase [Aspergillus lucknowensis]|uniref:Methyltransferase domain-containing protein n=1 Tax=Aspergillus lucknowensis TaxID=176173 RepID=A0ABR4LYD7_9EURO